MQMFGSMMQGLGQALDLYEARHRLLVENVANAETPGYRARDLDFSAALERAFEGEDGSGSSAGGSADAAVQAQPVIDATATVKLDGNSVDVDTEMARMSQNAEKILALSQIVARKFAGLRSAITDGRS